MLASQFPQVRYIRLPYNLGVIGGRNIGIANCIGDLVFFLDDDAILTDSRNLEQVYQTFKRDPDLGVMYCKIIDGEGRISPWEFRGPVETFGDRELVAYTFIGAAHCIRRSLFEQLGFMDQSYFRNGEEMDLSLRVYGAGYYVLYYPAVTVIHRESQITRNPSGQVGFYKFRNDILTYWKHLPLFDAAIFTAWNTLINLIRSLKRRYFGWYLFALIQLTFLIPQTILRNRKPLPRHALGYWYKTASEVVERYQFKVNGHREKGNLLSYVRTYFHHKMYLGPGVG